jgi:hypothetical protein
MLINKDENIKTSSVYVASLILKEFKNQKGSRLTIFQLAAALKKQNIQQYRQLFFGLAFLYSTGIVEFSEPYIYVVND